MPQASHRTPRVRTRGPSGSAFDQYLLDIRRLPLITDPREERKLAYKARKGDPEAAERLVTANLRFVISYVKRFQGHGLDLSELVAIGNEGLLKAVRKFDPIHKVKFISYAVWWIRQCVLKALAEQTRTVRIPVNQNAALVRMGRIETLLAQELGRTPTDAETAKVLNDTVENVRAARRMTSTEFSLDAPVERHDSSAVTFGERVAGAVASEIEESTDSQLQREFIRRLFQRYLTPRERRILTLYYGLDHGAEPMTLERIGSCWGSRASGCARSASARSRSSAAAMRSRECRASGKPPDCGARRGARRGTEGDESWIRPLVVCARARGSRPSSSVMLERCASRSSRSKSCYSRARSFRCTFSSRDTSRCSPTAPPVTAASGSYPPARTASPQPA
jgi:RNA polymerase primary sigma factor